MEYNILGRTGVKVSKISLGTWSFGSANHSAAGDSVGWANQSDQDSLNVLKQAWQNGINHWDTADVYGRGRSEALIGQVWSEIPRNEIFIATKVGWDKGQYDMFYHPKLIQQKFDASLKNLKSDFVDLYYFHHCHFGDSESVLDDALDLFNRFREAGKVRFIGLSDWNMSLVMDHIDSINPDVVQPYRNVMDDDYVASGLKDWIDRYNAGIAYFSPLKHGLLTGKYTTPPTFEGGDFRLNVKEFQDPDLIKKLQENRTALERHFKDHPEPVLHGLIDALLVDSPTGCVLLGQRNSKQAASVTSIGQALSADDAAWVKSLFKK
ncbi:aldo/keto reductase [Candidatus Neomarinimicrobiota bacterium]